MKTTATRDAEAMPVFSQDDKDELRRLAARKAEVADLPVQREKAGLWRDLNELRPQRPMVWINEIPWHEFEEHPDLVLQCRDALARQIELSLRRELFQWEHFPADMVVSGHIPSPKKWASTGIGITTAEDTIPQNARGGITSHHYKPQITEPEDIEKIKAPRVEYDKEATQAYHAFLADIFSDLLPVRLEGICHIWFTPWDALYPLIDFENILMDMVMRPDFVSGLVAHYVDARMAELEQMEALGLFSGGAANRRVGSGGYGYCDRLPEDNMKEPPSHLWGCGNAQIFVTVSPEQHWEFSLRHELRWLERWGLNYYGCCEPLHDRIGILRRIPNLRKISMSPWADIPKARENGAEDFVLSIKPSPALLASDVWDCDPARKALTKTLEESRGCAAEVILKDISTVRGDLERLRDWSKLAMTLVGA